MRKVGRHAIKNLALISAILSLGALSFVGMFAVTQSLLWSLLSMFFAVLIEGEVFRQNFDSIVNKLLKGINGQMSLKIIERYFSAYKNKLENNSFASKFYALENKLKDVHVALHELKKEKNHERVKALKVIKRGLKRQKRALLRCFQLYFTAKHGKEYVEYQTLLMSGKVSSDDLKKCVDAFNSKSETWKQNKEKYTSSRVNFSEEMNKANSWFVPALLSGAVLSGINAGLAILWAFREGLTTLLATHHIAIAASTMLWICIPVALLYMVSYSLLVANSVTEIMEKDWFNRGYEKIKKATERSLLKKIGYAVAASVLGAFGAIATYTTAGTFWHFIQKDTLIIPFFTKALMFLVNIPTTICLFVYEFAFNMSNTLQTISDLSGVNLSKLGKKFKDGIKDVWDRENFFQFINPFRLMYLALTFIVRTLVFLAHCIGMGASADSPPGMSHRMAILVGGINEFLIDFHYIFHVHEHDHGHHAHEGHHHSDIVGKLFKGTGIEGLFALLTRAWSGFFGGWYSSKKSENISQPHPAATTDVQLYKSTNPLENHLATLYMINKRMKGVKGTDKEKILQNLKYVYLSGLHSSANLSNEQAQAVEVRLNEHRNPISRLFKTKTESTRMLDKLREEEIFTLNVSKVT